MSSTKRDVVFRTFHGEKLITEWTENRVVYTAADGSLKINWLGGRKTVQLDGDTVLCEIRPRMVSMTSPTQVLGNTVPFINVK